MREALADYPKRAFRFPDEDLITVEIDPRTGLLARAWCPGEEKTILRQLAPREYCPAPTPSFTPAPTEPAETSSPSPTSSDGVFFSPSPSPSG